MQQQECWNHLDKLVLVFLYNFHPEQDLLKPKLKKLFIGQERVTRGPEGPEALT